MPAQLYDFDLGMSPPDQTVESIEEQLVDKDGKRVTLNHGDIVNFDIDNRFVAAYFVREYHSNGILVRDWILNPDISGSGYLTVPKEITSCMNDAIGEYSSIMSQLDNQFTAIYLAPDDVYLERYPELRKISEHKWNHKGFEVTEGREREIDHLLVFTEEGPVLHIETHKSYKLTIHDD